MTTRWFTVAASLLLAGGSWQRGIEWSTRNDVTCFHARFLEGIAIKYVAETKRACNARYQRRPRRHLLLL